MKWRISFDVDLGESIPAEGELKPHDYPLADWAAQVVHDFIFQKAISYANLRLVKLIAKGGEKEAIAAMESYYERVINVNEQAKSSMQVARLDE